MYLRLVVLVGVAVAVATSGQTAPDADQVGAKRLTATDAEAVGDYVLGSGDAMVVRALHMDEFAEHPAKIGDDGYVTLPLVGRIKAAGSTVKSLERAIGDALKAYVHKPEVTVLITEFGSQPISVIGSVQKPGIIQARGRKTLLEVLSLAGGLSQEAGSTIRITRKREWGELPLSNTNVDAKNGISSATVSVRSLMQAVNPPDNILVAPYDIISVPRADMVFVIGEVQKAGAIALQDRDSISILEALSTVSGLTKTAAPKKARILRRIAGQQQRQEIPINLKSILAGEAADAQLSLDDVLFIPASGSKQAIAKISDIALGTASGMIVFRR